MSTDDTRQQQRPRDPRSGEAPDPPLSARADDPTHGVDPEHDRVNRPEPAERPGLHGETAHRNAMLDAEGGPIRKRTAPAASLLIAIAVVAIIAALFWF
jgi:hypothetical protein